jgi:hypothetical protein
MNTLYLLSFLVTSFLPPAHKSLCSIDPQKAYSQNILGKNVGYYVNIKNNATREVDGIKWTAYFYNNFDDLKGTKLGSWESGNFISPVATGESITDLEGAWVDGATKVYIKITRVHFTDGTTCGK